MARLVLGLDIGITSVGYGVIDIDSEQIIDYGVRLFKEGTASENEKRRTKRGARRLKRRKINRIDDMKKLLKGVGILDEKTYTSFDNPYEIRRKGLTEKLSQHELACAILHITKNRGTCLENNADETQDEESTKSVLSKNDKELQNKYICEIQLERLEKENKIRGINNNFKTEDYLKELQEILNHQDLSKEIIQQILQIVARRRRYDQGPGSKKSPTPYGSYRVSDGEVIKVNLIDVIRGKCSVYPDELRAPKQSYTSELFNLLNDLNNLMIDGKKISIEDKQKVVDYVNKKGGITLKQLFKLLDTDMDRVTGFRIDKNNKPLLTEFKGYRKILRVFENYHQEDLLDDKSIADNIIDINTKAKGIDEREQLILEKYPELNKELVHELAGLKGISGYHSLSFKAMHLINKEMMTTEMNQIQILHQLNLFDKNRKSTKGQRHIYPNDEAILSPVAKRAHRETFKVINKLRDKYGEFDSIIIEMTRDKNTQEQKKRIKDSQKYFENKNKEIEILLKERGYDPERINNKVKTKVRLYLEQDGKSAYTLQNIDLRHLIEDEKAYEIDHIIPISISLDDSLSNKVLATHDENQQKGNLTPIQAYLKGKFNNCDLNTYKTFIKNSKLLNRKKKSYLLTEKDITKYDTVQEFINRNLVDTSYACRTVMNTLQHYFKDNEIDTKVHAIRGQATNAFRKRIDLPKDREGDYFHHAIDALIVASLKKLNLVNSYLMKIDFNQMYDEKTGEVFHELPDNQYLDSKYISFVTKLKTIYEESNQYILGLKSKAEMVYPLIKVSHKIDTKPNRKIADETIYSTRMVNDTEMLVERIKNIYDPTEKATIAFINNIINNNVEKYIMYHKDPQTFDKIKKVVLDHFNTFKDSKEYYTIDKKGKYELKCENPLTSYFNECGPITKYSKKNNGPAIYSIKFYSEKLGNHLCISQRYNCKGKNVIMKQISPYRTDFYQSVEGKYKFVTIRYENVKYNGKKDKYVIDSTWYKDEKMQKGISDDWQFICSMHRDEVLGFCLKDSTCYKFTHTNGKKKIHDEKNYEIVRYTGTKNDKTGVVQIYPINYPGERNSLTINTCIKIQKFATDVLGNLYKVNENILKLEFD